LAERAEDSSMRRFRRLIPVILLAGCSPLFSEDCDPPPATDVAFESVNVQSFSPPSGLALERPRDSNPHIVISISFNGEAQPLLAGVKVDGRIFALVEIAHDGFGSTTVVDAGRWDPPDTLWHAVEVVVDPLDLFVEVSEDNNRGSAQLRITDPPIDPFPASTGTSR
jgi:hypothetical protein